MLQTTLISSSTNDRIKRWKKIADNPRSAKKLGATLAEGLHLSEVILESAVPVAAVILREEGVHPESLRFAQALSQTKKARIFTVSNALYDAFSPVEHGSGITVEVTIEAPERPHLPMAVDGLYLDGVQDAGNVGTLIRTAVAAGVRHIAASPSTAGLWSPKVLRAGMGAHFGATLYEGVTPEELPSLFNAHFLAADARGGRDLFLSEGWEKGNTVWLMGAEGPGLSDAALCVATSRYLIPIEHQCESLNVAAAAAVCLFEQKRRRILAQAN